MDISKKTFLVLGLGRSGLATVDWLRKAGAYVMVYDRNSDTVAHACTLGAVPFPTDPTPETWANVSGVVQSPGIVCTHCHVVAAQKYNIPIYSDADLFCMAHPEAKIIGITGTNGKTTTTCLLTHILNSSGIDAVMGGNVGVPILSHPFKIGTWYVWELSSYQLEISQNLKVTYAGWLNISEDHLERHQTMEAYIAAKEKLLTLHTDVSSENALNYEIKGAIIVEDPWSQAIAARHPYLHPIHTQTSPIRFPTNPALRGQHNIQNMSIAYHLAKILGVDDAAIYGAISTFPGVEHRQEIVTTLEGITFINDSKATNADAAEKALVTQEKMVWIAGGEPKSEGIRSLAPYFSKLSKVFLIGHAATHFAEVLEEYNIPHTISYTLEQAVYESFQWAKEHHVDTVLFSPACASFDQFRDFEHRGHVFKTCVHRLTPVPSPATVT